MCVREKKKSENFVPRCLMIVMAGFPRIIKAIFPCQLCLILLFQGEDIVENQTKIL